MKPLLTSNILHRNAASFHQKDINIKRLDTSSKTLGFILHLT